MVKGLVIKNTGSWYTVRVDDGREIESKIKGNFRLKNIRTTNPVAVGDRVTIELNREGTAFITAIEERKNYIIRRASNLSKQAHILAANLDQALLIVTVNYPITTTVFIDRFLATAEAYRVPVKLVFNKIDCYNDEDREYLDGLIHLYTSIGYPCSKLCAKTEEELVNMPLEDREMFKAELGIDLSGLDKLIQASYALLGLISFITAGEKEVRAWTIKRGTLAPQAAGKIHTDFERGFIRADVVKYDDLISLGDYNVCKEKGKVMSVGKDYVVQDGDIMLFKFNV